MIFSAFDFINWAEVSRYLAGDRYTIRRFKSPTRYDPVVNDLLDRVQKWLGKWDYYTLY